MAKPATAPAVTVEQKSSRTVTVACKVPHGLQLQLVRPTKWLEETQAGTRERVRYDRYGERVMIYGNSYPVNPPQGFPERRPTTGGYAFTTINRNFWEQWLDQNKDSPIVVNRLIFALPSMADAKAQAQEQAEVLSGLEPLNPDKDSRAPRPANSQIGVVGKAQAA